MYLLFNRTGTPCLSILSLIRPMLRISRLSEGCIYIYIYPTSQYGQDVTVSTFKHSISGLAFEFSFQTGCLTTAKDPSLPHYLPIAGEIIRGFLTSPRVLVLCEMQSASSTI